MGMRGTEGATPPLLGVLCLGPQGEGMGPRATRGGRWTATEEGGGGTTRKEGPGTPGGGQGIRAAGTTMATPAATELEGGSTPSDTMQQ